MYREPSSRSSAHVASQCPARFTFHGLAFLALLSVLAVPALAQDAFDDRSGEGGAETCCTLYTTPGSPTDAHVGDVLRYVVTLGNDCPNFAPTWFYSATTQGLGIQKVIGKDWFDVSISDSAMKDSAWSLNARFFNPQGGHLACNVSISREINVVDGQELLPELTVDAFDPPSFLYANENVEVSATIGNGMPFTSTGSFYNELKVDGMAVALDSCGNLNGEKSCKSTFGFSAAPGQRTLEVCADSNDQVTERNETNNCTSRVVTFRERTGPNLVIDAFSASPADPEEGENVTLTVVARNEGGRSTGDLVSIRLHRPDGSYSTSSCAPLAVGGTCTRTFPWTAPSAGIYDLVAEVDPNDVISESNELDNEDTLRVTVSSPSPRPDFYFGVSDLTMSPSDPEVGEIVTFTITMRNGGAFAPSSPPPTFYANAGGPNTRTFYCPAMATGDACTHQYSIQVLDEGTHTISVIADPNDQIAEEHETNNTRALHYNVAGPSVTCQGTWTLTQTNHGTGSSPQVSSSTGSVLDNCFVYFGQNQPTGCWNTTGSGLDAVWHRDGASCPQRATVTDPVAGTVWEFDVAIQ